MKVPAFWRTREFGTACVLAAMLVACEIAARVNTQTSFLFSERLARTFSECSFIGIAALGAAIVIISGGVDLSSGSVFGFAGIMMAWASHRQGWPAAAAVAVGLLSGAGVGLLNGLLIGKLRLPPFIATLGFLSIARGLSYLSTEGITIPLDWRDSPPALFTVLGDHPGKVLLVLGVAAWVVLGRFSWGRYVYAVGGSEEAARFAGLRVDWIKVGIYVVAGTFAALAGCAYALSYASAQVSHGRGYELQIIAACALGGVSFSGGQGTVIGAMLGAATIRLLYTLLIQLQVPGDRIEIAYGAAIILAVSVDELRHHSGLRRWFRRKGS